MINSANLKKRLLFAAWAVPIGWWVINSNLSIVPRDIATVYPGHVLALTLVFLALFEYIKMLTHFYPKNAFWLSYLWLGLQALLYFTDHALPGTLSIYLLLVIVAIETFFWGGKDQGKRWARASLLFSGTVFLHIAMISLLNLYTTPFQQLFVQPHPHPMLSQLGIVTVLTSIFMCDTAAYFAGNLMGKHHFSTISPNKTIEGSVAGLLAATVITTLGWFFFRNPQYSLILGPIMGLIIGVIAQAGDLLVSLMKRNFQVKDASSIIPGHGGILDRFDSVFFTAPVLFLFSWLVVRITEL
ncbi:phosphatidate cytidylyltransferase [Chitinispirillales bacterium ANBcel5]|uniref:phosphatidate cytidylyltransferase n=1 Tax=Cellulosispirillum alkaliphilum TaxID=3039283 RepID=UPI002A50208F|nr:phosphatidate cytidylyltransferase [Chitinispirillales bacterium ANBcel5]